MSGFLIGRVDVAEAETRTGWFILSPFARAVLGGRAGDTVDKCALQYGLHQPDGFASRAIDLVNEHFHDRIWIPGRVTP